MFDRLKERGFEIEFKSHAQAILGIDFPVEGVLLTSTIPIEEIIGSGGGETKGTQRLRRALAGHDWRKHNFVVQRIIDGVEREAQSHEIDHVKAFEAGTIALEIEWNNKDPFFDRDLENFKRLHADGAISLGVIVTRGSSLHGSMKRLVRRFVDDNKINSHDDMERIGLPHEATDRRCDKARHQEEKSYSFPRCLGRSLCQRQVWRSDDALEQIAGSRAARSRQPLPTRPHWPAGFHGGLW
jgi:hypothetical protein